MYSDNRNLRTENKSICEQLFVGLKNKIGYFGDQSNLHGVGHVCSMSAISLFKRLFWIIFLAMCCFGAASILQKVLGLYSKDLVSYSVETDYLTWETPFPAVSVCDDKLKKDKIKDTLVKAGLSTKLTKFFEDVFIWTEKFCRCDFEPDDLDKKYVNDFQKYTTMIRYNCSQLLTACFWDGVEFPCCEKFLPLETEVGVCYSFNSQVADPESKIITFNRNMQRLPNLVFTALIPDHTTVKIHAPEETLAAPTMNDVLGRDNSFLWPKGFKPPMEINITLKIEEQTVSDVSVSTLPPSMRGCLYKNERPAFAHNWPFKIYSLKTCFLYCRAAWQAEQCNCTHLFMPKLAEMLLVGLQCGCPLACEETSFKLIYMYKEENTNVLKGATRVRVSLASLLSMRVRRQALRNMLSLVVDIGGLGGVFFGGSLLSVIEIIYLFFIRSGP